MKKTFCYWTVADGNHGKMAATTVASARKVGVNADFHIWTDLPSIEGATVHPCGTFDKTLYMFKFHFLKNEVSKLNYDYFVFFDADNYFVKDPGDLTRFMGPSDKVFVQMENNCDPKISKRRDWWSCPIEQYASLLQEHGVQAKNYYNTNAGFWIVRKDAIDEFYEKTTKYFEYAHKKGYKGFTEEPALAYVGHIMQDPEKRTFDDTNWLWASDWTGQWKDKLPEYKEWLFEDYMTGEKKEVKPYIVHCMRSKDAMIREYDKNNETGYWIGHQLLGDVIGFVAAAHLMYVKTGNRQKVWFQESRKGILDYFDGVDWVPRESIPKAIDCGGNPTQDEWPNMNGVKRFYKWMDMSLTNPKSFDIHFNRERKPEPLIGLITHANTQGDIPNHVVDEMVAEARKKYPKHRIVAIGNMDNKYIPSGVEDMRQEKGDIKWIVENVRKLDLLITPQTGPCFIAAGFRIPMWVYRSKEKFWDNVLNYDEYKVERWWERVDKKQENVFDEIYKGGGWNGQGSGPGSLPENNKEYIWLLHKIIEYTPNIDTIVDLGCGDFQLMNEVPHTKKYIGVDTSSTIIDINKKKYPQIDFRCVDIVNDELPNGDLVIIKDVLQHLSNSNINKILNKIKKYKWCVITNDYASENVLYDIEPGQWRPLNILLDPYKVDGITLYGYNGKHVVLVRNI
jgi:hypothetical protein